MVSTALNHPSTRIKWELIVKKLLKKYLVNKGVAFGVICRSLTTLSFVATYIACMCQEIKIKTNIAINVKKIDIRLILFHIELMLN